MKTSSEGIKYMVHDSQWVVEGRGGNVIPPANRQSLWRIYLEKFSDPIIIVLLIILLFSVGVSAYEVWWQHQPLTLFIEPIGIALALLLATGVGFVFEVKASREFELLNKVKDSRPVKVIRRSTEQARAQVMTIAREDVVVGDVVRLESGDEVPADGELLRSLSLRVDESIFTGEPYAQKSELECQQREDATYPSNFMLRGSTIIEGNALYRVTAVGMLTEEGRGVAMVDEGSGEQTPLNIQLAQLGRWISVVSFVLAVLIVVGRVGYYFLFADHTPMGDMLHLLEFMISSVMIAVTLIVVAVPEGLPMSVTVSLALSMRRMLKEKNLVRKLHACETMGAATVICTDKTGTLTQNRMTVVQQWIFDAEDESDVLRNMAANSTADLGVGVDGEEQNIGNPTECALLRYVRSKGEEYATLRSEGELLEQIPFSTEHKYMLTRFAIGGESVTLVKGAPEIVMAMCEGIAGKTTKEQVVEWLDEAQQRAMRTLAFASSSGENPLMLRAVVAIADPIRDDVAQAISTARNRAGVRVIIVTGDTPRTAVEIARQISLVDTDEEPLTITGPDFESLSDEQAQELVANPAFKIISRARPMDKARLVELLQRAGEVVAVTGDGTNDAPALSRAQVGLSMGDGTSRAKEASDITIIDNSFSSINSAIMWGRSLYLNIRRFIIFQMTINVCACLIVLLGAFTGLDSPLNVTQMLWVNLIMDTFAAMALSSLPADRRVLDSPPRSPKSHIVDRRMLLNIVGVGMFFFVVLCSVWQLLWHTEIGCAEQLLTKDNLSLAISGIFDMSKTKQHLSPYELGLFFSFFVLLQFWNLFNAKYFRSGRSLLRDLGLMLRSPRKAINNIGPGFISIAIVILLGQICIVEFAGSFFGVEGLHKGDWATLLLITSPVLLVGELFRLGKSCVRQ